MNLAPIVLFTFNRLNHTQKTVEALKQNILAEKSELFIFSDASRNSEEKIKVDLLREYLKTIDGFKKVTIIEAEKNMGLAKAVISGVTDIIEKYDKVIVLEDDLVTSKYFLKYMNEALDIFEKRNDIWSISGYSPNIVIPNEYNDDIYIVKRASSWGWATWKNRWVLNEWDISDYETFKKDKIKRRSFNETGSDMSPMLDDQMEGRINSWAIRWAYNQFIRNKCTVYPVKSLVKNIGNDLSGTHTSITNKYDVILSDNIVKLNLSIKINDEICSNFRKFYNLTIWGYVAIIIKKIGLYKQVRKIRNTILKKINLFFIYLNRKVGEK